MLGGMNDPLLPLSVPHAAGFREVSPGVARAHLQDVRVVDVREPQEFVGELGHVRGAELVPLGNLGAAVGAWRRDQPLLLICRSGGRSGRAAAALAQAGFSRVYNLDGGMLAWNAAGLPTER